MKGAVIIFLLWVAAIIGEIRCIYQFCTSDFEPSYKREWIYGIGMCTWTGAVIGYFNIHDTPSVTPIPNAGKIPANPMTDSTH